MKHILKHISRITWDQVVLILGKIGTLLVDRRFLYSLGIVLAMVLGVKEDQFSAEIAQIGTIILGVTNLLSYTVRPPSGLKHKEVVDTYNMLQTAKTLNGLYQK